MGQIAVLLQDHESRCHDPEERGDRKQRSYRLLFGKVVEDYRNDHEQDDLRRVAQVESLEHPHEGQADSHSDRAAQEDACGHAKDDIAPVGGRAGGQSREHAKDGDGHDDVHGRPGEDERGHLVPLPEPLVLELEHGGDDHGR